jgi:DNA-binding beta-propeller fold protein YncE
MKKTFLTLLALLTIGLIPQLLHAQTYVFDKKITLTGDGGYDYVAIDKVNNRLYVSHGTMVNVVDLSTEKQIGVIENMKGVHGIVFANKHNRGFITDGRANAVVAFDLKTLKIIATIPVEAKGPDGMLYDPYSDLVFSFNGESNNASVVNPVTLKQVGNVDLGGGPEFAVSDNKGKIYNNIEDKNTMKVIDSKTLKIVNTILLAPCGGPTGLAIDTKHERLFTACRENKGMSVININSGKVITTLPIGAGVDAVAYDPETKLIFCSNGDGTTTIIKQETADKYAVVQTLATQNRAKTLALDAKTHKIYLSVADFETGTRKVIPNSFKILVYKPQ